ncbi:MAG: hypothetical protein E6J34_08355 [Chloroflexi bacterium]|nr:MAG: hypothetical protein E6J34_08355 [Chloroflexota bacterium]
MNLKDNDHRFSKADDSEASCKTPIPTASTDCTAVHEMRRGIQKSDIAITGISGRFADSANLEAFWSHLQQGHSCIKEIQPRKGWETYTHSGPDSEHAFIPPSKWGGMLYSIDQFDSLFFDISPHEATRIDPQQRLFLQEAYKAFEDAGYCAEQLSEKKVGVFVGARPGDYKDLLIDSTRPLSTQSEQMDAHLFLGNDMAILAARISYFLNCKGPSLTIDTASSSSLVAIHLACESIRTGESEMALAGGVFVMSSPAYYLMAAKTQLLAPDGKCKTFDKNANGIVIGEGVGALVLKPLEAAIADGDHLYGIIKGSAINQDGKTFGMTAPSLHSQKALLCDLYKKATINPATVTYLEAHGTGSKLGDPIEMQALNEAFHTFTDKKQFCAIGSHKPNIGHTVTCAGIAGVFKVLLAMKYQQIPPTLHVEETNPQIDFQNSPFFINTELREWKSSPDSPRRAGVSAFGLSGTNCHLILEEPSPQQKEVLRPTRPYLFFPFSAKTQIALMQKIVDMVKWLEKEDANYAVEDISYTLVQGRSHFAIRHAVVARNSGELKQCLSEIISNGYSELHVEKKERRDSQAESFLQPYGHWLLQELLENVSLDEEEYRKRLVALSALYVKGCNLNWERFFEKERYFRIPLPTYPFSGESYWIVEDRGGSLLKSYAGTPLDTADPGHDGGQEQTNTFLDDSGDKPQQFKVVLTDRLSKALSYMVSDLIKVSLEDIDIQTPLSEYGFDSITYIKFAHRLQQSYRLDLTPAHFFDYPTLECLAQYLHATYASVLTPYFATAYPVISQVATDEASRESSRIQQHACIECSQVPPTLTTALPIAIIGISGSFPQAPNVQSLWYNLLSGRDCISEIPPSRWSWQSYFGNPATEANKTNVKWAGIAEDVEWFDPLFFGISPGEAEQMDPPQRLLMTHIWKAIEDAGYAASSLSGTNTALFVGSTNSGYHERLSSVNMALEGYSATGQTPSVGPNRMSYLLNLHGPSEAIETACSSSLVAIHRGVSAIESGQCDMAIVGGVNTLISPALHISYSKAGMLCEDGRCKTFSAAANGYARGEGVGILVLKKLSDAERDADHIYGVIIGSAENHGGHASSLTAPNPRAQADLLLAAYRKAGIDPGTVGYIEAHGTGTPLGDPIEINGLKTAFSELAQMRGEGPLPQESCGLGSLKSYIGHLELAAGVAGVIKVLLQLQHKKLVKNLHCEQINPYIQLQDSPFYIVQQNREWEAPQDREGNISPRRAGVSSFGFGGANAHVVLEEYLPKPGATLAGSLTPQTGQGQTVPLLIVLSARNEERLYEQVQLLLGGT